MPKRTTLLPREHQFEQVIFRKSVVDTILLDGILDVLFLDGRERTLLVNETFRFAQFGKFLVVIPLRGQKSGVFFVLNYGQLGVRLGRGSLLRARIIVQSRGRYEE